MSILAFQMPEKVVMEKADDFHGLFTFKPLEQGYGVTVGNALRRILLSSLEGYAITGIKVPGVLHEFSTMEGIVEDLSEIILNLKMVRFKKIADVAESKIVVSVSGQKEFKGSDIGGATSAFEVLNPDHVIAHLDEKVKFEIELTIEKVEVMLLLRKINQLSRSSDLFRSMRSFTPIKNVKYSVENTRVEQKTDYEQLILGHRNRWFYSPGKCSERCR